MIRLTKIIKKMWTHVQFSYLLYSIVVILVINAIQTTFINQSFYHYATIIPLLDTMIEIDDDDDQLI